MQPQPSPQFLDAVRHHEAGNLGTAERLYKKVLDKEPGNADAWYLSGYLALQRRRLTAALAHFDRAIRLRPGFTDAQFNRAGVLAELGRLEEAAEGFGLAARCPPPRPEAFLGRAQALTGLGRIDDAAEAYRAALEVAPEHPGALAGLAGLLRQAGRDVEALPHVITYARTTGNGGLLLQAAREATERGRPDIAHAAARAATDLRPDDAEAFTLLAKLSQTGSLFTEAEAAARRAMELDSGAAQPRSVLGQALFRQGRTDEAREALAEACRLSPDDLEARHFLSLLTGEVDEQAKTGYARALFDGCAATFERTLVDRLDYAAPWVLADDLRAAGALDHPRDVIDLGCGTGLCGEVLKPHARRLDGIDLAPGMVEAARRRGVYDEVAEGEMTALLAGRPAAYDLAVAADVLIYVGESADVFAAVRRALRPGGWFAFSIEVEETGDVTGRSSGRFAHSGAYIRDLAARLGFVVAAERDFPLRRELDGHINGRSYVLRVG